MAAAPVLPAGQTGARACSGVAKAAADRRGFTEEFRVRTVQGAVSVGGIDGTSWIIQVAQVVEARFANAGCPSWIEAVLIFLSGNADFGTFRRANTFADRGSVRAMIIRPCWFGPCALLR